jgi:hypothetical protein
MAAASRSLATALWRARFASGLLHPSYTINRDTTLLTQAKALRLYRLIAATQLRHCPP